MRNETINYQQWLSLSIVLIAITCVVMAFSFLERQTQQSDAHVYAQPFVFSLAKSPLPNFPLAVDWSNSGEVLGNGYFNLGSLPHAVIKISAQHDHLVDDRTYKLSISRNNIFTPMYLVYEQEGEVVRQLLKPTSSNGKLVWLSLPEVSADKAMYLELSGKYLRGRIAILTEQQLIDNLQLNSAYSGAYYGMAGLVILASLFIALIAQSLNYASYSFLLLVTVLWISAGEGWLLAIVPTIHALPFFTANSLGMMCLIALAMFSSQYLQLRVISKPQYQILRWSRRYLSFVWLLYCVFFRNVPDALYQAIYAMTVIVGLIVLFVSFAGALTSWRRGRKQAAYYLCALTVFVIVGVTQALSMVAIMPWQVSWHSIQLASMMEIFLLGVGFVVWHRQQIEELNQVDAELNTKKKELALAQLDIEQLKKNMSENLVPASLTPQIAQVVSLLPNTLFIKASGNYAEVHTIKGATFSDTLIDCNLQTIEDALGQQRLIRCHKSYLILPTLPYQLLRRSSADFDLVINNHKIPVGRKFLSQIRAKFDNR
ncbi:7TM diverse intracellular signaling domain-containing protein [Thalassotalea fusca]